MKNTNFSVSTSDNEILLSWVENCKDEYVKRGISAYNFNEYLAYKADTPEKLQHSLSKLGNITNNLLLEDLFAGSNYSFLKKNYDFMKIALDFVDPNIFVDKRHILSLNISTPELVKILLEKGADPFLDLDDKQNTRTSMNTMDFIVKRMTILPVHDYKFIKGASLIVENIIQNKKRVDDDYLNKFLKSALIVLKDIEQQTYMQKDKSLITLSSLEDKKLFYRLLSLMIKISNKKIFKDKWSDFEEDMRVRFGNIEIVSFDNLQKMTSKTFLNKYFLDQENEIRQAKLDKIKNKTKNTKSLTKKEVEQIMLSSTSKIKSDKVLKAIKSGGRDMIDENGKTTLFKAAQKGFVSVCRELIENGADIDIKCPHLTNKKVPILNMILKIGGSDRSSIFELLFEKGVNADARDDLGRGFAHYGYADNALKYFEIAKKYGVNFKIFDNHNNNPLHTAIHTYRIDLEVIRFLLKEGVSPLDKNIFNKKPSDVLLEKRNKFNNIFNYTHGSFSVIYDLLKDAENKWNNHVISTQIEEHLEQSNKDKHRQAKRKI